MEVREQVEEVLEIINFGGIQEARFEIKPVTIMIGPQASGKSVVAKLLHYFRSFCEDAFYAFKGISDIETFLSEFSQKFMALFPPGTWPQKNFRIRYWIQNEYFEITRDKEGLAKLKLSRGLTKWLKDIVNLSISNPNARFWQGYDLFIKYNLQEFKGTNPLNLLLQRYDNFIPAGRGVLYLIERLKFSLLQTRNIIDKFLLDFGSSYDSARNDKLLQGYSLDKNPCLNAPFFRKLNDQILKGEYLPTKKEDLLRFSDGRTIPMHFASSGQQESLPLLVVLEEIAANYNEDEPQVIYVEEPEAHLFPAAQRAMVELLALVVNSAPPGSSLVITTHSPYVLTVFDNLIKAGTLMRSITDPAKKDEVSSIIPEELHLNPEAIAAYALDSGHVTSMIDQESGLIIAEPIDEVSELIDKAFSKLIDVEYDF